MPAWLWALYLASFRLLVVQCSTSVLSDEPWRPTVSKSIQKSANRSKWRHAEHVLRWRRRLQETTTLSTQTFPGFNTKRSELCVGQGQSVLQEERPLSSTSLSLCSYCRGPDIDPCIYDVSECFGISQGSSCRVRCKAPYLGASSIALCPASGISGEEANLSFRLPNCVAALEQDKVSCPNPATIPSGYLQVQETGQWTCRDGYYGEAVRECTLLRVGDACVLQAVFSGCLPLLPCRRPDPASDFQDAVSDVPSCGFNTSGCENVQPGASCQIHCQEPFMGNSVTAACPSTNTDPDAQLIYTRPQCQKRCPSSAIQEVGPGYNYDFDRDRWSCAEGFTGQAVKLCEIDDQCGRNVSLTGCAELRPCQAPTLDSCRYDWSSCGDLAPGTSCRIACRTPFEGEGFPATCWANNSDPMAPLNFEVPWCNLNCPDPLPLPEGYTRQATGYRCDVGYTGIVDRSCSVVPEDCSWEVTMTGCDKLVSCKALPEPEDRCQFDVEDCQRPVPLGQSCETRCREPYIGLSSQSKCPTRNTDPERTVDFLPPSCAVPDCPEPVPRGYAKTENGWQCAPGYGGTVLSSCTTCGRLVLRGCTPAIPCKPVEVEDPCRYNTTDCSTPIGAGESCMITCGNAYQGEPTFATCPADNVDPERQADIERLPGCSLYCGDPDPLPEGYVMQVDFGGGRRFECAAGYIGQAESECLLLDGCTTTLQLSGCLKLQPCLPLQLQLPHSDRYEIEGCDSVQPGQSCLVRCSDPWTGPEALVRCPENNLDPNQPLIVPEDWYLDRHGVMYNSLWPPKCSLRCDSLSPGYEKVLGGRWRCAPGFIGEAVTKSCYQRGACDQAVSLEGCRELLPCTIPGLDACKYDVSDCGGFQRGTSCEVKCRAPFNGTARIMHCPQNNTELEGGLIGELPDCEIEECMDPVPIPANYEPIDAAAGLWSCAAGYTGLAQKQCVAELTEEPENRLKQDRYNQYGMLQPECAVRGFLEGCVVAEPCAQFVIEDTCMFAASSCNAQIVEGRLVIAALQPGESCEVSCKAPYQAQSSLVQCPSTNTNVTTPPDWTPPECELGCPNVPPPPGYVHDSFDGSPDSLDWNATDELEVGDWTCAEGFTGNALRTCRLLSGCSSETIFSGCSRLLPCRPFLTQACGVNDPKLQIQESACARALMPGESCTITCGEGHVGGPFMASCPAENTRPGRQLDFASGPPICERIFPEGGCYDPVQPPPGYVRPSNTSNWTCAEGFVGSAQEVCEQPTGDCGSELQLRGCIEQQPCKLLELDSCYFEAIGCAGLMGGESCQIHCRSPSIGTPVWATCPVENVDPDQEPTFTPPVCSIPDCDLPDEFPAGYEMQEDIQNGTIFCADKFAGRPEVTCVFEEDCSTGARLSGCLPLQACAGPANLDACRHSINLCLDGPLLDVPGGNDGFQTVKPGGECQVSCRGLFVGTATVGRCPLNNTDPSQPLIYDPPLACECPDDLSPWPEGYNQTGVISNDGPEQEGSWYCEEGYGGVPQVMCAVDAGCQPELMFEGCATLQTCKPMNLTVPQCQYDISNCTSRLDGGETCEVLCRLPAVGDGVVAFCPDDNTVPDQELMATELDPVTGATIYRPFQFPLCETPSFCPDPDPLPDGYVRTGTEGGAAEENYACAEGYSASPRVKRTCVMSNSSEPLSACLLEPLFEGCPPIVNCSGIDERMIDTCRYDVSNCPEFFEPGSTCEVSCREPFYIGTGAALATCPTDNTDPEKQIEFPADLVCTKACPEPDPVPAGYEKVNGEWRCAAGYLGSAIAECFVDSIFSSSTRAVVCVGRVELTGCDPMASCQPPTLDLCIYDVSDCIDVIGGTNCSIRCRSPPYEGTPTNASCPYGNLDPFRVVDFEPPSCELRCPVQEVLPDGYNYSNGSYVCLDSWFGSATAECVANEEDCSFGVVLSGCGQSSPCVGVMSNTTGGCYFDVSPQACLAEDPTFPQANFGRGPGGSCTVSCRPPCSAPEGEQTLICPASNLNAQLPLQGILPTCSFDCDPTDRNGGYVKGADGEWLCAQGFAGEVVHLCMAGEVCADQLTLTGCAPQQPCLPPIIDDTPCIFDVSECEGVPAGGSCFVRCAAPYYLGSIRPASCSINNTRVDGRAELSVRPVCTWNPAESCPDPPVSPAGYTFDDQTGVWICAPGYVGTAIRQCALRLASPNSAQCIPEASFLGCLPLTPCIEPIVRDCTYNTTAAANLTPGSTGLIYCNVPYDGVPGIAQCPIDNNQEGQEPPYVLPDCFHACPPTAGDPVPPGFSWQPEPKEWVCDNGYRSPAEVNCTTNIACEWKLDFGGCEKLEPCADLNMTSCVVDGDACVDMNYGDTCTLSCRAPFFVGVSTIASCPSDNIEMGRELQYTLPSCEVTCPDPDTPPAGYRKAGTEFGVWECAAGYSGTAEKSCHTSSYEDGCVTSTVLSGCLLIVPCKAPDPRTQPPCFYDTSLCHSVPAGSSCTISCLAPYSGSEGRGSCRVNNTDPHRRVSHGRPSPVPK
ncbi:unnamed protein product [Symbiodinium microadriaticum]|nr:unnamed protein product [Symbiodinium microadriaticum]